MSLEKYNQKRDFKHTSEPKGKLESSSDQLIFVVQKHAASHLHYDFRLELEGVLKSWAVPKGPSLDPTIKRLAMMVEDHPYSYKDFEGTIPKGNYGAGNVIVWDTGTYESIDEGQNKTSEQKLTEDLKKGHLSFTLHGTKLKGAFSLVKLKGKQENAWLLLKKQDSFATDTDILTNDISAISGLTLEAVTANSEQEKRSEARVKSTKVADHYNKSPVAFQSPMLATAAKKSFDDADWIFENKYDGYRTIAVIKNHEVQLYSRNEQSFTTDFQSVTDDLKKLNHDVVLDGEVVVENEHGQSDFELLQNYMKTGKGKLKYYVFDMLNLDENDITNFTLLQRKELLENLLSKSNLSTVFYSEHIHEEGIAAFEQAENLNAEGIMAKKANGNYHISKRSNDWLKIKVVQQEEAVIIGITEPKNSRSHFGALLLAQYKDGRLTYIGKCGTGFTEQNLHELHEQFLPFFVTDSPIIKKIALREKIQWVEPKFVCSVKFAQFTKDGKLRHPVYSGLRPDKNVEEVIFHENVAAKSTERNEIIEKKSDPNRSLRNDFEKKIGKQQLVFTNQSKIYFPEDNITKGDLIAYYDEVASFILPYLKGRPESLNRFPNGIDQPSFYQKDIDLKKVPSWLTTKQIASESGKSEIDYLICNDKETLLYMINLGCIDLNPWNSTVKNLDNPDWLVIDLDPEKDDFKEVVQAALAVKEVLDQLEVDGYCKTSGATGLHVYIPLGAKYEYDSVKLFAQLIAREVQAKLPDTTTLERSIKKRNHKIYIDYLQNRKGQTIAAPYSVRPRRGATVSTPLEWSEVNVKLSPSQFTIKNVLQRFEKKGDLWKPVLGPGIDMLEILKNYNS
ncbi:DNA ligase D [Flavobacterium sp. TAB 87]|uniref:DNA ligase D n=1 Tax=Flavobacterium sp. TAB 87 TaxID=1729581 RepID=UPI00076D0088|nr:DNA ligase D [Flavobacterium sp. TAB 87]KVV15712.1 putative DNA ligase-like protein/MT0965 [Flavobacterium sp. TAB 87]